MNNENTRIVRSFDSPTIMTGTLEGSRLVTIDGIEDGFSFERLESEKVKQLFAFYEQDGELHWVYTSEDDFFKPRKEELVEKYKARSGKRI